MKRTFTLCALAALMSIMGRAQTAVTPPENATTEDYTLAGSYMYQDEETQKETEVSVSRTVQVAISGTDFYLAGLHSYVPDGWIKGTLNAARTEITIATPQFVGYYMGISSYPMYLQVMTYEQGGTGQYPETVKWSYNAATGEITIPTSCYPLELYGSGNSASMLGIYGGLTLTKGAAAAPEVVTLPDGLTAEEYLFSATDTYYEENVTRAARVAISGTDVYMNGVSSLLPEAWIKGTMTDGKITFAANQFLGQYNYSGTILNFYFNPSADVVFDYDAVNHTLKTAAYTTRYEGGVYDEYSNVVITKVTERAAMPAAPSIAVVGPDNNGYNRIGFDIAATDTEGNPLLTSKLFYQIYVEKDGIVSPLVFKAADYKYQQEDLSVIPYGYSDSWDFFPNSVYIYEDYTQWTRVGIQSIYTGGGETNKTEIQWFNLDTEAGIEGVRTDLAKDSKWYNMQGVRIDRPNKKGIYIVGGRKVVLDGASASRLAK